MYLTVGAAVVQLTLSGETYLLFFPLDKSLKKLDNQLQSSLVFSFTFHIICLLNLFYLFLFIFISSEVVFNIS